MDAVSYLLGKKAGGGNSPKIYETTINSETGAFDNIAKDLTASDFVSSTIKANFEFVDAGKTVTGSYYYNILFIAEISSQDVILLTFFDDQNIAFIQYTYSPDTGELAIYNA